MSLQTSNQQEIAEILWQSLCREPGINAQDGSRGKIRRRVHQQLLRAHYRSIHRHRSGFPWIYMRKAASWLARHDFDVKKSRFEPLEWSIDHSVGFRSLAQGEMTSPLIVGFGFPRSGTTTLQNAIYFGFPSHLPPYTFNRPEVNGPQSPLAIWWFPKHDPDAGKGLLQFPPEQVRVIVVVRPFEEVAAALWHSGFAWQMPFNLQSEFNLWQSMTTDVALHSNAIAVPFQSLKASSPIELIEKISSVLHIPADRLPNATDQWSDIYEQTGLGKADGYGYNLPSRQSKQGREYYRELVNNSMTFEMRQRADHLYNEVLARAAIGDLPND